MKVWVIQHLLTKGIIEVDAEIIESGAYKMAKVKGKVYHKQYWCSSLAEAKKAAAHSLKVRKERLLRDIKKLEQLEASL